MNFNEIKNIIFDLGNVIINIDFALTYRAFEKLTTKNLQEVYEKFEAEQLWERYELGELTNQAFVSLLQKELEISASDQQIIDAWNALLLDIPKKRLELIERLAERYRLFILSNTSDLHIIDVNRILRESSSYNDLKELVEVAYYSFEMEQRKPDEAIYKSVLQDSDLKAEETLFLDDNYENIVGAKAVGLKVIHVQEKDMCDYLEGAL